jgi:hypothetical protein
LVPAGLLVPDVHRPGAASCYRVTRDEERAVYDYRVGTGQLECFELSCEESRGDGNGDAQRSGYSGCRLTRITVFWR